jgi:TRAP-type C4-dicarboxylate transport system permease small subunit
MRKYLVPIVSFGSLVATALFVGLAQAQVTTTWSIASTTALGTNAETNASGNAYNMILLIVPITLGLAAFFFALRWLWHRIAGRH